MRIAVVVGVAVPHDAISAAAVQQVAALQSLPEVEEVHLFTHGLGRDAGCPAYVLGNPWELLRHAEFRTCDVAIFHWGIHFALFDAITLLGAPELPAPVVHFHNCTPPSLVPEEYREHILRSIQQLHHVIDMGTPLWTYSEFNRRTLIDWGAAEDQITWVTFPIVMPESPTTPRQDDRVHLLSVGRMVPAKGVHVLLDALATMSDELLDRLRVRIVSSTTFSSEEYRNSVLDRLDDAPPSLVAAVQFVNAPTDDELAQLYGDTDVVVSTSFHEGLCVPIIEGYTTGCRAIGTTAGNLQYVVFPPDPVVPPGDPAALALAISGVVSSLSVDDLRYHDRCAQLVEAFSTRCSTALLRSALADRATT